MKTKVQTLREAKNLTQSELAKKSGLSLRTVQRMEAGNTPRGFTLKALADALDVEPHDLIAAETDDKAVTTAKYINISALSSLLIPFGNLIFPTVLTFRSANERVREYGKEIIGIQLIYTFVLCMLLILCPFIQKAVPVKFPLFVPVLIVMKCVNLFIILKNGASLTHEQRLYIRLKNSIL